MSSPSRKVSAAYPHTETTWPRSRELADAMMRAVSDHDVHKLLTSNKARLYGIPVRRAATVV